MIFIMLGEKGICLEEIGAFERSLCDHALPFPK
jgi:hypothetical protein